MHDDVGSMIDRAKQHGRCERVVDDERDAGFVRNLRERIHVCERARRVADRFRKQHLRIRFDGGADCVVVIDRSEGGFDAHAPQRNAELRDRAAVDVLRADDVIAVLREREHDAELRGEAARERNCAQTVFQARHAFFERRHGRIAYAAVDMAVAAQLKELGCLLGRAEDISCRLINGRDARAGYGVGRCARVDGTCRESELAILHGRAFFD